MTVDGLPEAPRRITILCMAVLTTRLFIVRHALAEDGPDDHARRLTKKGRRSFSRLVRRLAEAGMDVDLIATSPLVRARETAELLAKRLPRGPRIEVVESLAPGGDWETLLEWTVHQDAAGVAWVGHAPAVGRLVALSIGDGSAAIRMAKGAVASIRLDDGPGQPGELEWLATPALAR